MLADLDGSSVCTGGRQGTAHRLQDEGDDIGGDEDPVEVSGWEPRDRWINEVDAGGSMLEAGYMTWDPGLAERTYTCDRRT